VFWDFHTEAWADSARGWSRVMDAFQDAAESRNSTMRIMLLEENAWPTGPADHGLARGARSSAMTSAR
jgi:hypothetical protein